MDLPVQCVFFAFSSFQLGDNMLYILAADFIGYKHSIGGFDDNQLFHAN